MIRCGHCGEQHRTVAEVRACAGGGAPAPSPPPVAPAPVTRTAPAPDRLAERPASRADPAAWEVVAGPDALGRNLVIGPGGLVPAPWEGAERIVIDEGVLAAPAGAVERLQARGHAVQRTVLELAPPTAATLAERAAAREPTPAYELGPAFAFEHEILHHLVWANSVDGRVSAGPVWPLQQAALRLGAQPGRAADVVLPDGREAWLDGGPVRFVAELGGRPVVHRVAVEHGSLEPPLANEAPASLAPDQAAAVTHPGGGARVIAPAGSGKTRVLTERARLLRAGWRVPATALTLVAFNKRAQEEMHTRTTDVSGLHVRTLNSLALAIVNGEAPFARTGPRRTTIDETEVRRILDRLVKFPKRRNVDPVAAWIEALTAVRLGLRPPAAVETAYNGDVDGLTTVFPAYRDELQRRGVLDFDEQVFGAIELLLGDAAARHQAQRACRVLLVDELQDLTPAHMLLLRLVSAPEHAVFGVGDDDQTIYGYNGADPSWLLEFGRWFPGAGNHPLEVNYRCPPGIVEAVDRLLRHNRRRVPKVIRASRTGPPGWRYVSVEEPLAATVDVVGRAVATGTTPSAVAVLTRVNSLLAPVQVALARQGVPVNGGVGPEFLSRTPVRAALAWLRLARAAGSFQTEDLAEAIRRPARSVSPRLAEWIGEQSSADGLRRLAGRLRDQRDVNVVQSFAADLDTMAARARAGGTTRDLLEHLNGGLGLGRTVASLDRGRQGMNRAAQSDDLDALVALATLEPDPDRFPAWLAAELRRPTQDAQGVTLATIHRVKGQEWPLVVLHHADEHQLPHRLAEDVEEERRLFHVALTRAQEEAVVVATRTPTPFLAELFDQPPAELAASLSRAKAGGALDPRGGAPSDPRPREGRGSAGSRAQPDRAFPRDVVLAVPGQVLVDQGQEWRIVEVVDGTIRARSASSSLERTFRVGASVVTAGGRRGRLRPPAAGEPEPIAILAEDRLRATRKLLAAGKPAYTVVNDATIEAVAVARPHTLAELADIKGIGPRKLDDFGDQLLAAVLEAEEATHE